MNTKRRISLKWTILWSLWAARLVRQPTAELQIESGSVRGYVSHDGSHCSYLGIPYATVGPEHRFKAAGPPPKWNDTFEAINEHIICSQQIGTLFVGRENCLILNIYTPLNITPDAKLPVMVYIHGGGYITGSGTKFFYGPKYLVSKGVILVTITYRLHLLGFLCLRTKEAPGNAGMKDQVAALRWVQRNIRVFGGDPDNVTLFGESAGGASVSYHVLSPMSKGLFHKAITQSGSALAPWGVQWRPIHLASLVAKIMGYQSEDPKELYRFFMSKSDAEIVATRAPRKKYIQVSDVVLAPCAETEIEGEEAFITKLPYGALKKGNYNKVSMIIGANSEEGHLFVSFENDTAQPEIKFEELFPNDIVVPTEEDKKEISDKLKRLYMDNEISKETILKFSKFIGDSHFIFPAMTEAKMISDTNDYPVFTYIFDYSGWKNFMKLYLGKPFSSAPGATHGDEVFYIFQNFRTTFNFFENKIINTMSTLWTNFAKYGDPTPPGSLEPHWPATQRGSPRAQVLGPANTQPLYHSRTLLYWKELYHKYRRTQD